MPKTKQASKSRTGVKKAKDPNAPKRAMSAFFFWMQENRERLKKPGMGVADVAKAADLNGHNWLIKAYVLFIFPYVRYILHAKVYEIFVSQFFAFRAKLV